MAFMFSVSIIIYKQEVACIHKSRQIKRGVWEVVLNDLYIP